MSLINYYSVSPLLNFVMAGTLGLSFYLGQSKYKNYILFNCFVAIWSLFYTFWQFSTTEVEAMRYVRLLMLGATFTPHYFLFFIVEYLGLQKKRTFKLIQAINLACIAIFIPMFLHGNLLIKELSSELMFQFWPKAGPAFYMYLTYFFSNVLFGYWLILRKYIRTQEKKYLYVFVCTCIAFTGGSTNFFLWIDIPVPPFLNVFVAVYVFLMGIFILRADKMGLKSIVPKYISYVVLSILVIGSFGGVYLLPFETGIREKIIIALSIFWALASHKIIRQLQDPITKTIIKIETNQKRLDKMDKIEKDLQIATGIQTRLLPEKIPTTPNAKIESKFIPSRGVSGDYYYFFQFSETKVGILIADMVGKGVAASYYMFVVHGLVKKCVNEQLTPKEILYKLNNLVYEERSLDKHVPLLYGVLDSEKGTFTYSNAGHEPWLHISEGKIIEKVPTNCSLGLGPNEDFEDESLSLKDGDRLLLYTDGLTDIKNSNGERYGTDRLLKAVKRLNTTSIHRHSLLSNLIEGWFSYGEGSNENDDDLAIISVLYQPIEKFVPEED